MRNNSWIYSILIPVVFFCTCSKSSVSNSSGQDDQLVIEVKKWYNDYKGAVTITYDSGWRHSIRNTVEEVINRNMHMDLELVTSNYDDETGSQYIEEMKRDLIPNGIHFFGHGHEHINHDELTYEEAYQSFKTCYDLMESWELPPLVYAYPGARGYNSSTQQACQDAGFISARGYTKEPDEFYICPDSIQEPDNWFYLPSIPIAQKNDGFVHTHTELVNYLDTALEKSAWVIIMYHAIGVEDSFGYYPYEDFVSDLDYIDKSGFWNVNYDSIVVYIKERNSFHVNYERLFESEDTLSYSAQFCDDKDNNIFNHPLTLQLAYNGDCENYKIESEAEGVVFSGKFVDGIAYINQIPDEKTYTIIIY